MTAIPGIQIKKNDKGEFTHISIDLQKHPEIVPALAEKGLLPKSQWETEIADCVSVEELRSSLHQLITNHYAKQRSC